ncbi:MAG: hypothetical protein FJ403_07880 [Verrucomicrobia bacterium]|nr:hypothetical protein [Verrucomicrobiota bacterium]
MNIALALALFLTYRSQQEKPLGLALVSKSPETPAAARSIKTNVVVRRQYFTWQEIESEDYPVYIANLRRIGCPESTIRDIIVAEVNTLFARKRATEIITPEQQWWRSEPDVDVSHAAAAQLQALELERQALLVQLLGPNWEGATESQVDRWNLPLDGPVLGALSADSKQAVRNLHSRSVSRLQEHLAARQQAGQAPDPSEAARLRQETREALARVLTPAQMEEYLLRYSQTAQSLRAELQALELTPDEFRSLFRARDAAAQQIQLHHSGSDVASAKRREGLEGQQEAVLKQVLGSERFELYKFNQDPAFRQAQASAQKIGAPAEAVLPLYQINQAIALERERIRADASLTLEQRAAALAKMLAQQQDSLRKVLGRDAYDRYIKQQ